MHFSRPSGQRLSWCRPWKRGAVGNFSNGYCSVTTFLNIVRKVTPNPATGSQNCSFRVRPWFVSCSAIEALLRHQAVATGRVSGDGGHDRLTAEWWRPEHERSGRAAHGAAGGHGRDREATGGCRLGFEVGGVALLALVLTDEEQREEED